MAWLGEVIRATDSYLVRVNEQLIGQDFAVERLVSLFCVGLFVGDALKTLETFLESRRLM